MPRIFRASRPQTAAAPRGGLAPSAAPAHSKFEAGPLAAERCFARALSLLERFHEATEHADVQSSLLAQARHSADEALRLDPLRQEYADVLGSSRSGEGGVAVEAVETMEAAAAVNGGHEETTPLRHRLTHHASLEPRFQPRF